MGPKMANALLVIVRPLCDELISVCSLPFSLGDDVVIRKESAQLTMRDAGALEISEFVNIDGALCTTDYSAILQQKSQQCVASH